jgi:hypothetical protein
MNILSCFDSKGNVLDKGTLINGNGTIKMYDIEGELTGEYMIKDGEGQN